MDLLDDLKVSKIVLITGAAGARKDFVAGWLGLCKGFVRTQWRIDTLVGYSQLYENVRTVSTLLDFIQRGNLRIDPTSSQTLAITCHVDQDISDDTIVKLSALVNSGSLTIAGIDLQNADMIQYHWDRLVKVYLCLGMDHYDHHLRHNIGVSAELFNTPDLVTDAYAASYIENKIAMAKILQELPPQSQDGHWPGYKKLTSLSPVDLDYAELFKPGGSYYLCKMLGVSAPERAHNYWSAVLPFINAPESCDAFGKTWNKSMIVK